MTDSNYTEKVEQQSVNSKGKLPFQFALLSVVFAIIFIFVRSLHYTSLQTNMFLKFLVQVSGSVGFIGMSVGFLLGFVAFVRLALKKFKEKGAVLAVLAMLIAFLAAALFMPTMGFSDEYVYLGRVNSQIVSFLNEYTDNTNSQVERSVLFHNYSFEMEKYTDQEPFFIKLHFVLRRKHQELNLPNDFEVYIHKGLDKVEFKLVDSQ